MAEDGSETGTRPLTRWAPPASGTMPPDSTGSWLGQGPHRPNGAVPRLSHVSLTRAAGPCPPSNANSSPSGGAAAAPSARPAAQAPPGSCTRSSADRLAGDNGDNGRAGGRNGVQCSLPAPHPTNLGRHLGGGGGLDGNAESLFPRAVFRMRLACPGHVKRVDGMTSRATPFNLNLYNGGISSTQSTISSPRQTWGVPVTVNEDLLPPASAEHWRE